MRVVRSWSRVLFAVLAVLCALPLAAIPVQRISGQGTTRPGGPGAAQLIAPASPGASVRVNVLSETAAGMTLELTVPWEALDVRSLAIDGRNFAEISLPGTDTTDEPGLPRLPFAAVSVGVPFDAEVALEFMPGPAHTVDLPADVVPAATTVVKREWAQADGGRALPSPRREVVPAQEVYDAGEPYPGPLAEVRSDGVIRQQRVVNIALYPVQYRPLADQVDVYKSLVVRVEFEHWPPRSEAPPWEGPVAAAEPEAVEGLFRSLLLNYESARQWRRPMAAESTPLSMPWAPPVPGYRLLVAVDGLYRRTCAELAAAGLPVGEIDPRTFQLFSMGSEVAVYFEGEADGVCDPEDWLLFYGQAVESKYTAHNVYWLTYGHEPGLRMVSRDGTPSAGDVPAWFADVLKVETNSEYAQSLPGSEDLERFVSKWLVLPYVPNWTRTFVLAAPSSVDFQATLHLSMYGELITVGSPWPRTQVRVNGSLLEDQTWPGNTWRVVDLQLPQSLLTPGSNTVSVTLLTSGSNVFVDEARLRFANTFQVTGDRLRFSYSEPGTWQYAPQGFSSTDVTVFDVTTPTSPVRILGVQVEPVGEAAGYRARFEDSIGGLTEYWAATPASYLAPVRIEIDTPSNLASMSNGADYIAITHADFLVAATALRNRRASAMRAVVVDVQDVYDEFGFGIIGARPIHDFLTYAYQYWQRPAPLYVVLVGDGHYDPKNYLGYGLASYLPPYLAPVDPWIRETASDNRYVTLVGDDNFPDMIVGRLAVNSQAQAQVVVDKVIAYEASPPDDPWKTNVLFVADDKDAAGDFAAASEALINCCLPPEYTPNRVYLYVTHPTKEQARAAIIAGINSGQFIVNYIGHAGVNGWAAEGLFGVASLPNLNNADKLPIMVPLTCWDGYFHYPHSGGACTAESLVRASGKGAVASWSPSGLGVQSGHDRLGQGFFGAVFDSRVQSVGLATWMGKWSVWQSGRNLDLLDTYILFGDPALLVNPPPTSVVLKSFTAEPGEGDTLAIRWETVSEIDNLGFNLYRAEAADGPRIRLNESLIPSQVPPGSPYGATYLFVDDGVVPPSWYYYWLESVDVYGQTALFGPIVGLTRALRQYLPLVVR